MRDHLMFYCRRSFVGIEPEGAGVLSVQGAGWFVDILRRVEGISLDPHLCQEDWGVVFFASRHGKKFWIGLNWLSEGEWLVHLHPESFGWLQRFSRSGKQALAQLIGDVERVLRGHPDVYNVVLCSQSEVG